MASWRDWPRKIGGHARLLRRDPERFGRNLLQVANPALFEERLVDMLDRPPMHVRLDPAVAPAPRLNVLDTAWTRSGMTGGPNTAINLALRVAREGIPVRLVSTAAPAAIDPAWFRAHGATLIGAEIPDIPIVSAADPVAPLPLTPADLFLATHWSTARQLKPVLPTLATRRFFFMLQEFEPGFYAWSSNHALALEALGMDYWPIVNEAFLADYLFGLPYAGLSNPATRDRALVFEPAVDRALFHSRRDPAPRSRRLLFYARPTNSRNMFGLGLAALREVAAEPIFQDWQFTAIGSRDGVPDLPLGGGHVLRRGPWVDYAGYADLLRGADILLCPMLSPHTSYPVLEMVACGGLSVTNTFLTKTAQALWALSDGIVTVPPTVEGFAAGLLEAAARATADTRHRLRLPRDWAEALDPIARGVAALCRSCTP